jgi:hypothetical protein
MNMKMFYATGLSLVFLATIFGCSKTFTLSPVTPATATPTSIATSTPTLTSTPCGFPGNTCTWTFTPTQTNTSTQTMTATVTSTFTATGTPTNTATATATSTFTPLPTPIGVIGLLNNTTNYATIAWAKDTNPNITSYNIYMSTDGVTYNPYGNYAKTLFSSNFCAVNDNLAGTTFNRYYYVTSSNGGAPPDSAPSRIVHAVSGTTNQNGLTLGVFTGGTPVNLSITGGSVAGGVKRVWYLEDGALNPQWMWGEEATVLTTVNYGYSNATGVTYYPKATLVSGTTYYFDTFTLNSENWEINWTSVGFVCP